MKQNKGITLIALIITIIVMLVLVVTTVSILINSNVIGKAKSAGKDTQTAYANESNFGEELTINVGGETYTNINDAVNSNTVEGDGHTYHLESPDNMSPSGQAHIYLYDENNNKVPIKEEYIVSIPWGDYALKDGGIEVIRHDYYGYNAKEIILSIAGQEISESFFIAPPG